VTCVGIVIGFLRGKVVVRLPLPRLLQPSIRYSPKSKFSTAKLFNGVYIKDYLPHSVAKRKS